MRAGLSQRLVHKQALPRMVGGSMHSTRVSQPFGAGTLDGQIKVPRVIANLEPTDRVQYMTPDSVSGDQKFVCKQLSFRDSTSTWWR